VRFEFDTGSGDADGGFIRGDSYLVSRLFRNALDNAVRYARSSVRVSVRRNGESIEVAIEDDGDGMSVEAMANFGQRRSRRFFGSAGSTATSLGLGSVIIRTIVELHHGRLALASRAVDPTVHGTRMMISFPCDR
jgi:K+-sensing histidine kinase KdpD